MLKLTSPSTIKYIMDKYNFRFSKSLGQNFLIDEQIIDRICDGADIGPDDDVLEIGPGIGVLTMAMAQRARKVVAIEIDRALIPVLKETLEECDNVEVIHGDVLKVDLKALIAEKFEGRKPKVVANLPYNITTPIIMMFLEEQIPVSDIVVMIQKEVAERISAVPSTKAYGALSVATQYYSEPRIIAKVPRTVFMPAPNVDSIVIRMTIRETAPVELENPTLFFKVVKAAFGQRRKTLHNALNAGGFGQSKDQTAEFLRACDIDPSRRGETLNIQEFATLANYINNAYKENAPL
jgi:16S rRNA (adenine1518-N6/adenine1519-N6)-dimethyltransferase